MSPVLACQAWIFCQLCVRFVLGRQMSLHISCILNSPVPSHDLHVLRILHCRYKELRRIPQPLNAPPIKEQSYTSANSLFRLVRPQLAQELGVERHSMNGLRGPYTAASSKATAQTLCQKCLKKDKYSASSPCPSRLIIYARHYSYECKASAQERPYTSRPSRTQQLANPKLVPRLTSDVPNDLLRK